MQIQQGDVIGLMVDALPAHAQPVKPRNGNLVVAEGEATGHAHRIAVAPGVTLHETDDAMYLSVEDAAPMTHEEHDTVTWPPGIWKLGTVREKDWFADAVRPVLD